MVLNGHFSWRAERNTLQLPERVSGYDRVLQGFFAAHMQLQLAVGELPRDSTVKPRFNSLMQLMSRVIEQGRSAIQGLRASHEQVPSFGQAVSEIPCELGLNCEIRFRVVVLGSQRELEPALSDELYSLVREAILNAYRHSGAKEIEAEIEYRTGELRVAVRDSGCGIDSRRLQRKQSGQWGLQGMRERAEGMGARLRVSSRIGVGTEVELRVPGGIAFESTGGRLRRPAAVTGL